MSLYAYIKVFVLDLKSYTINFNTTTSVYVYTKTVQYMV